MTALEGKALLDHGKAIAKRYAGRVGPDLAEELGAEAVLRVLHSPPPDGHLEPWLERIYRNLVVDVWRRRRPVMLDIADVRDLAEPSTPEAALLASERRRAVRASVARLPREARRALLARYYGEYDDEISAGRLGIAGATIRTRIHRALGRLRGRLGDLRGLLPPVFGKLGAHLGGIALAPVMFVALAVVGVSQPEPEVERSFSAEAPSSHHAIPAVLLAVQSAPAEAPAAAFEPSKRVRVTSRTSAASRPAPAQVITFVEREDIVADIQRPEGLDVYAVPVQDARPCLVEAPTNFLAQFEKMVEDSL